MFDNLGFRFIKVLDIGYTTVMYFLLAIVIAILLDKLHITNKNADDNAEQENDNMSFMEIMNVLGVIWLNGIIIYFARNIIELVPSPFNNIYGFKHSKLHELKSAFVFDFVLLNYQKVLHTQIISSIKTVNKVLQRMFITNV